MSCKTSNFDCNQGRDCTCKPYTLHTLNSDGSNPDLPITMIQSPWAWISDMFYTAVYVAGSVALGALLAVALVFATGLHKVFF